MKALYVLLILLLLSIYKAEDCSNKEATKDTDCTGLDPGSGVYRCCYQYVKGTVNDKDVEQKTCLPISKTDWDTIKDYVKKQKEESEKAGSKVSKYEINCSSNYLYISLLSLVLILL